MAFKRTGNIIFALVLVLGLFTGRSVEPAHADGLAISTYSASTDSWNTFLGGAGNDSGGSIAVDGEGNIYTSGTSNSNWGNPIVPYTGSNSHRDGFLAKLDSSGNLLWNTFMGSSTDSVIYSIALDGQGNVYVAGDSSSTWGAPLNGFAGINDVFIAKFNSDDGSRLWNTFLGGTGTDYGFSIAVDGNGAVYVTGCSAGTWGSPKNAFASLAGTYDGFAAKLDSNGTLQWNTFMGGGDYDWSYAIAVDKTGQYVFVTGDSFAAWGTPVNPFGTGSSDDGFVVKLDTSDGTREWNTFFGGSGSVNGLGIVVDGSGNPYVSGFSDSTWGTPISEFSGGASDGFIAKLNSNGVLQWNTFLGGTGRDTGWGIALVGDQNLYLTGNSTAAWGDPLTPYHSGTDAFIAQLNTAGNLLWNTFIGGTGDERSYGIAIGGTGDLYILGDSTVTWGTPVRNFGGAYDAFVASYLQPTFIISGNAGIEDAIVNYTGGSVSAANDGNYSITIPYNWSGTVTPSKFGYSFTPANRDYANVTADKIGEDYVATPNNIRIVTNTNPWGAGSLGDAIFYSVSGDTIIFDPTLAGETIYLSSMSITKSIIIDASNLNSPVILDGQGSSRLFQISSGITFEIKNIVLTNGYYNGLGGAIYNQGTLKLTRSSVTNSKASSWGGGIYNTGQLIVVDSTFSNNIAIQGDGGAIFNSGTTTLQNSTFNVNSPYALYNLSTLNVTNSTFTSNGIAGFYTTGALTIKNSTVANNGGYGIEAHANYSSGTNTSTLRIENTILANNGSSDCYNQLAIVLLFINNLVKSGNCGTPVSSADPKLGTLADNGGPTWTMGLLAGSPAIDAGDDATCQTVDQRGITRPQGPHCDIGAFENDQIIPPAEYTLTINKVGSGTVTPDKAAPYHLNDVVGLAAMADADWSFYRWTGACSGSGACSVTIDSDKTVSAIFIQNGQNVIYDDADAAWTYTGNWVPWTTSGPDHDTLHYSYSVGDTAQVAFTGQQFKLSYAIGSGGGLVDVYVDDVKVTSLDQNSSEWYWQKSWTSDLLPAGNHTLRLVLASASFITLDSLEVIPSPVILTNGVHDDGSVWTYTGEWTAWSIPGPYLNTLHYSFRVGDSAQVAFTGQQIKLTYFASPMSGIVDVYVDGAKIGSLNQYSPFWEWQKTWTSDLLSAGTHNLRLAFASGGSSSFTNIDSIEVIAAPVILSNGKYDDAHAAMSYTGRWDAMSGVSGPYSDTLRYSYYPGDSIQMAFSGRQIRLSYLAGSGAGLVEVYVDGAKVGSFDQSSPTWAWQKSWTSDLLPAGTHNLRLVFTSGLFMSLDSVEVIPSPLILSTGSYDDANAAFTYDGSWLTMTGVTGPYQGTLHYTYGVGDSVQVAFNGRQIELSYLAGPDAGIAEVYVDGVKVTTLDQTGASWEWQKTWTSDLLSAGDHSLRLVYSSGSSSSFTSLDALTVIP